LLTIGLLLVLGVGAVLRLARLPDLPAGLHYDEAANGVLAAEIARGVEWPVFISSYTGKEVLFFYWAAAWMRVLGEGVLALRLTAAVVGLCTLVASAWCGYELFHSRRGAAWIGVLSAAFLATSVWHLILSRYGFRAVTQPLLQALTVGALWRGLRLDQKRWLVLAGLFGGATLYTYLAARAFPLVILLALLVLLFADKGRRGARLAQIALVGAAAVAAVMPLVVYFFRRPEALFTRMGQVAASSLSEALDGLRRCLGMFFIRGDPYIRFNWPFLPLLDWMTAMLFIVGLGLLIRPGGWQQDRDAGPALDRGARVLILAALLVMLLPSALATGEITPSNLRVVGLIPFIYYVPAVALARLAPLLSNIDPGKRLGLRPRALHFAALLLVLALLTPLTAWRYFVDWAPSSRLYLEADGDLADVAAYLNEQDLMGVSLYVGSRHYRHPTLAFLAEDYPDVSWLVGGDVVVIPAVGEGLLILPRSADAALEWLDGRVEDLSLAGSFPGPDDQPAFRAFELASGASISLANLRQDDFGRSVELLGYELLTPPRSGEELELLLHWHVRGAPDVGGPLPGDMLPVVRLVDRWGGMWGEARPFQYPSEQWSAGEEWVQRIALPVPPGTPPGDYGLQVGFYSEAIATSLPLLDPEGAYAGSAVELPLTLERAAAAPAPSEAEIDSRIDLDVLPGLTLLGYNLSSVSARSGEQIHLALYWWTDDAVADDLTVRLTLGGAIVYQGGPVNGSYPTSRWTAGELVADRYSPRIGRDEESGTHHLLLELLDSEGTTVLAPIQLGDIEVQATGRTFESPSMAHELGIPLGGLVELLGYDLAPADDAGVVAVTLYWQALAEMETSYTVFVHVLAPEGGTLTQHDGVPAGGSYPTTLWVPGEVVADLHLLEPTPDLTAGEYEFEIGMYVLETGQRLPVPGSPDGAIHVLFQLPPE
jgi:hypothetical protein